jgi:hypothetical protein
MQQLLLLMNHSCGSERLLARQLASQQFACGCRSNTKMMMLMLPLASMLCSAQHVRQLLLLLLLLSLVPCRSLGMNWVFST